MGENNKIGGRYMDDPEFQNAALPKIRYRIFYRLRPLAGEPFDTPAELAAEELAASSQSDPFSRTRKCAGCGLR
jgi:hypothetical protein